MPSELFPSQVGINDYKNYLKKALEFQRDSLDSAIHYANMAFEEASVKKDKWKMAMSKSVIARTYQKHRYRKKSLQYNLDALELLNEADTSDYFNQYIIYRNVASVHGFYKNYQEAIDYYDLALVELYNHIQEYPDIADKMNDHQYVNQLKYWKAINLQKLGKVEEAASIFGDLSTEAFKIKDHDTYAKVLHQVGLIMYELQGYDRAVEYFGKVAYSEGVSDYRKSMAYHNLGLCYFTQENFEKAEGYYLKAIELKTKVGKKSSLFFSMIDLAETYMKMGRDTEAIPYLETALTLHDDIDSSPEYFNLYKLLAEVYLSKDIKKTKSYLVRYGDCISEFIKVQQELKDLEARRAFNLEIQQFLMAREMEKEQEEKQNLLENYWILTSLLAVAVGLIIFILLKYRKAQTGIRHIKKIAKLR